MSAAPNETPPTAAEQAKTAELKDVAMIARLAAEKAAYAWACDCPVGPERTRAFDFYENIRCAGRIL